MTLEGMIEYISVASIQRVRVMDDDDTYYVIVLNQTKRNGEFVTVSTQTNDVLKQIDSVLKSPKVIREYIT